jgi:predicted DNA-binding transcriptional regulator AlpA
MRYSQLPATGYMRLAQIIGRPAKRDEPPIPAIIPVSKSTWWSGVRSGKYPKPTRALGQRITAWRVEDIRALIMRADDDVERRGSCS